MGFFVLLLLIIGVIVIISLSSGGHSSGYYHGGYIRDYDDDYEDYEIRAGSGDREYFSDDLAQDYCSYYAQVADAADMGDQDAKSPNDTIGILNKCGQNSIGILNIFA